MDQARARRHLDEAVVARLATVGNDGNPHLVPVTFAREGDSVYFAVDQKPKRTTNLRRLRNIAAHSAVARSRLDSYSAMRAWSSSSGRSADSCAICATICLTRGSSAFASSTVYVRSRCTAQRYSSRLAA